MTDTAPGRRPEITLRMGAHLRENGGTKVSHLFEVIAHLSEKGCAVTIVATRRSIEGSPGDWVAAARYVPTGGGAKRWAVVQRVGPVVSSTLDLDADTATRTAIAIARREGGPGDRTRAGGPDA